MLLPSLSQADQLMHSMKIHVTWSLSLKSDSRLALIPSFCMQASSIPFAYKSQSRSLFLFVCRERDCFWLRVIRSLHEPLLPEQPVPHHLSFCMREEASLVAWENQPFRYRDTEFMEFYDLQSSFMFPHPLLTHRCEYRWSRWRTQSTKSHLMRIECICILFPLIHISKLWSFSRN